MRVSNLWSLGSFSLRDYPSFYHSFPLLLCFLVLRVLKVYLSWGATAWMWYFFSIVPVSATSGGGTASVVYEKAKMRGKIKTQCWSHFTCVLFYIIDKDKSSLHLQVLPKLLVDDITMRLSCGRLHALLIRSLLLSSGSFLLVSGTQPSATIKGFHTTLMQKGKLSKLWHRTKSLYKKGNCCVLLTKQLKNLVDLPRVVYDSHHLNDLVASFLTWKVA